MHSNISEFSYGYALTETIISAFPSLIEEGKKGGGHDVPEGKIRERYDRSAPLIREAVHLADIGLVYDNSVAGRPPKLVLTFERGLLVRVRPNPSVWIGRTYAADILGASNIDDTE